MSQSQRIDMLQTRCGQYNMPFEAAWTAADLMQTDVKTLTLDDSVKKSLDLMHVCKIRHIPVMDTPEGGGKPVFVGVISQRDVLRLKTPEAGAAGTDDLDPKALRELLARIVTRNPITVEPAARIEEVITTLIANHIDMLPVLHDAAVVGLITATDLVRLLTRLGKTLTELLARESGGSIPLHERPSAELWALSQTTVQNVMARQAASMTEEEPLLQAIELLKKRKFRHLPIVDAANRLVGIVSDRDILRRLPYMGVRPARTREFRQDLFRVGPRTRSLELRMADIMTRDVHVVSPDENIFEAARLMLRLKVSCLPAVAPDKTLNGILTQTDLLRFVLGIYETPPQEDAAPKRAKLQSHT
ncbi:MAG: CBS domain-containing protein [Phycisphaerae bacterium]|nr:CBS domain-containing protein [Phycisphaerae bacterium]